MPGHLLSVPLHRMKQTADCLAACVAMVLDYLGHPVNYDQLIPTIPSSRLDTMRLTSTWMILTSTMLPYKSPRMTSGWPG